MNTVQHRFKAALAARLGELSSGAMLLKPLKHGIKILDKDTKRHLGDLYFDYLRNAGGVYVGCQVAAGAMHDALGRLALPYDSNLLNAATMGFTSLSEERREFSADAGGVIAIHDGMDIDATCDDILKRLAQSHIPRIEHLVAASERLIDDVVADPLHYSFPLPLIAICLLKNGCQDIDGALAPYASNKRISRHRKLDFLAALKTMQF